MSDLFPIPIPEALRTFLLIVDALTLCNDVHGMTIFFVLFFLEAELPVFQLELAVAQDRYVSVFSSLLCSENIGSSIS